MITINSIYSGASFSYANEGVCTANGEFRKENGNIVSININGQYTSGGTAYNFWANRDASGNVNISGVPASVIAGVATEVATIIAEVEAIDQPANEQ